MKDYSKLHRTYEYDQEKATLLAEAMTELTQLEARKVYLLDLLKANNNIKKFLWQSADGKVVAFHDLDTEHLVNILNHLHENGRDIAPQLAAEAQKRNIALPGSPRLLNPITNGLSW